ncbi:DNA-binding protein [Halobellus salinisoli]|uniref:DNA-binding protein n=1 Tax=Halobellus salinisoli TaxID=3108500 RepID=UPI00300BDB6F
MTETHSTETVADRPERADYACEDCGRRFYTEDLLNLHRGVTHPSALDEAERDAYREVYAAEERAIRSFRLRALGILVLLYFGFLFLYVFYAS